MARAQVNGKTAEISVADLTQQIDTLRAEIAGLAQSMVENSKDRVETAKDTATHVAEDAVAYAQLHAEDLHNRGVKAAEVAQEKTTNFIKDQPATALGLAAGAGFLIGYLTSRR